MERRNFLKRILCKWAPVHLLGDVGNEQWRSALNSRNRPEQRLVGNGNGGFPSGAARRADLVRKGATLSA